MFKIPVGMEDFDKIRASGSYYVDKTELIYGLVNNMNNEVTLFTRPRRFGKTLMMSMMESFFDINRDSRGAFEGLEIRRHEAFCQKWMNQYPVLFVSFKNAKALNFEDALAEMKTVLANLCKDMAYLAESAKVDADDKASFIRLKAGEADLSDVKSSLLLLTRMLKMHFDKKVILLIDEYDVPLAWANENGYYRPMLDVIRAIFEYAVKTNRCLQFAVVTGCLRIAKESIFTGANNFASYSVLDDRFSQYFGFTQAEVEKILKTAGLEDKRETIKAWYDGYVFGSSAVYCPWDVANYVAEAVGYPEAPPKNYWANTSHNAILKDFVDDEAFNDVSDKFEILMNGGTIRQTVVDDLTYDVLKSGKQEPRAADSRKREDNLWSILLMTGYLTKANPKEAGREVELRIPNQEIAMLFQAAVVDHFENHLDRTKLREMMAALWNGDEEKASQLISEFLWKAISYNNYHEDFYHAFLTGIFAGLGYAPKTDREYGLGRPDIVLKDRNNRRAMIIEAKKVQKGGTLESACEEGLQQIVTRRYAEGLALEGYETILCYAIGFLKKKARIKRLGSSESVGV